MSEIARLAQIFEDNPELIDCAWDRYGPFLSSRRPIDVAVDLIAILGMGYTEIPPGTLAEYEDAVENVLLIIKWKVTTI